MQFTFVGADELGGDGAAGGAADIFHSREGAALNDVAVAGDVAVEDARQSAAAGDAVVVNPTAKGKPPIRKIWGKTVEDGFQRLFHAWMKRQTI